MSETYYRAVTQILIAYGCYMDRQGKGSHETWYSPITKRKTLKQTPQVWGFMLLQQSI